MPRITSHEYARKMQELAQWLLERPEFPATYKKGPEEDFFFGEKEDFLAAARALGSGQKKVAGTSGEMFVFRPDTPEGTKLEINIARDKVCRKVQDAVWECEPMLSKEEEAQVGAAAVAREQEAL